MAQQVVVAVVHQVQVVLVEVAQQQILQDRQWHTPVVEVEELTHSLVQELEELEVELQVELLVQIEMEQQTQVVVPQVTQEQADQVW